MKERIFTKRNILYLVIVIAVCAILIRVFVFEAFFVRGDSMAPTILPGDYVLVNKLAYAENAPKRGDIVVVIPRVLPNKIVKRIIGLPREIFSIENERIVLRNERGDEGIVLDEKYLVSSGTPEVGKTKTNIDPNEFFVLGDNRNMSIDSRELGMVDASNIRGRVFGVVRFSSLKYIGF